MKKIVSIILVVFTGFSKLHAQQFIEKASIEFEVKTNVKKTLSNNSWTEMLKESMPQFKTAYYKFTFNNNKSIYQFDRWADGPKVPEFLRRDDEENIYYFDHDAQKMYQQKPIVGSNYYIEDSIIKIDWRLTNESRVIAGFNCRKAVGKIMDSVYVFAFYTDEIMIPGGPCTINGLPGMILGLTIPRLYVSYIATKVTLTGINEENIKPVAVKKANTRAALRALILDKMKDWGGDEDEESINWKNQFKWSALL